MITKIKEELIGKKITVYQAKGILSHRYRLKPPVKTTLEWNKVEKVISHICFDLQKNKNRYTIYLSGGFSFVTTNLDSVLNLMEKRAEIIETLYQQNIQYFNKNHK